MGYSQADEVNYNVQDTLLSRKVPRISLEAELDLKYWAFIPQLNYNHHCYEIELQWLCFGIQICFKRALLFGKLK